MQLVQLTTQPRDRAREREVKIWVNPDLVIWLEPDGSNCRVYLVGAPPLLVKESIKTVGDILVM